MRWNANLIKVFLVVSRKVLVVKEKVIDKSCREFYGLHFS